MSDIGPLGMGSTVDMLSNAIAGASAEHDALANNIANANTPGYRRQIVSFKEALTAASNDAGTGGDDLQMIANDDRHFGVSSENEIAPFDPKPQADQTLQMRMDKSNVDVDQEMAQLSENSNYGQTMTQLLQVQFMRLREAITERPG